MGNTIPHGDRLHECAPTCPEWPDASTRTVEPDWTPMEENVALHSMLGFFEHEPRFVGDEKRWCGFHSRLGLWTFSELRDPENPNSLYSKQCLRDHPDLRRPTKTREGDQVIPDGDLNLVDDQQLLIDDIEARRQVGITRYGQGHRPFNGRDTLIDMYEEQLDFLVYLRSVVRMAQATRDDLVEVVASAFGGKDSTLQPIVRKALAEVAVDRIMGYVAGQTIDQTLTQEKWERVTDEHRSPHD